MEQATPSRSPGWRTVACLATALLAVVSLLASCVRAEVDAQVGSDGKVSGVVIVAFSGALLEAVGQSKNDLMAQVRGSAKDVPGGIKVDVYDVDGYVGERITFSGLPAEQFGPTVARVAQTVGAFGPKSAQDFVLRKSSTEWRFFGTVDLSKDSLASIPGVNGADVEALMKGTKVTIRLTFPGRITGRDKAAKARGKTITWSLPAGTKTQMQAIAKLK